MQLCTIRTGQMDDWQRCEAHLQMVTVSACCPVVVDVGYN